MASAVALLLAFVPERLGGGAMRPYYNIATAAYLFVSKGKSLHLQIQRATLFGDLFGSQRQQWMPETKQYF